MAGILVVEDQGDIANLVRMHVEMLGHRVQCCDTLAFARRALAAGDWDLLVLDLALPDGDGLELCRELRQQNAALPILMLTARATEHERVQGLESGADDYLAKPFGVLELQARVRALLRRAALVEPSVDERPIEIPPLRLDPARRAVRRGGSALELTATEFDLLLFLARRPGVDRRRFAKQADDRSQQQHGEKEHQRNNRKAVKTGQKHQRYNQNAVSRIPVRLHRTVHTQHINRTGDPGQSCTQRKSDKGQAFHIQSGMQRRFGIAADNLQAQAQRGFLHQIMHRDDGTQGQRHPPVNRGVSDSGQAIRHRQRGRLRHGSGRVIKRDFDQHIGQTDTEKTHHEGGYDFVDTVQRFQIRRDQ